MVSVIGSNKLTTTRRMKAENLDLKTGPSIKERLCWSVPVATTKMMMMMDGDYPCVIEMKLKRCIKMIPFDQIDYYIEPIVAVGVRVEGGKEINGT